MDNYHMFVQPQLQLNDALQTQQYGVQRNAASVAALGERLQSQMQASNAPPEQTGAAPVFITTGFTSTTSEGLARGSMGPRRVQHSGARLVGLRRPPRTVRAPGRSLA